MNTVKSAQTLTLLSRRASSYSFPSIISGDFTDRHAILTGQTDEKQPSYIAQKRDEQGNQRNDRYEEKIAVIISTILFVCAVVFTLGIFIAPYVTKTDCVYEGNTYQYEGTVSYTNISEKYFEIYISEYARPRRIKRDFLQGKEVLLSNIQSGDRITYWTYLFDTVSMPEATYIDIVALTINETPVYTLEENNNNLKKSLTRGRILVTVFSLVLIIIGIVLLVRAYKPHKNNLTNNSNSSNI